MKIVFNLLIFINLNVLAQNTSTLKLIHIPHPRSEDKVHQSVLPALEQANYTMYDMIMLGGDITYYTSRQRSTLEYCDSLFDLENLNTLWSMGNHDIEHRDWIREFTGRESYYAYYRDGITFLVLDTEIDVNGFEWSHISGDQLQMMSNVCDTISKSSHLVVLHGRLLWMIGNDYLETKLDSVAESTRQLDTSNFITVVYPHLQKAKSHGVNVLCLGGDKSRINLLYSPEDSITYFATTMAPEFSDLVNNVLVLEYDKETKTMQTSYITLAAMEKNTSLIKTVTSGNSPIITCVKTYDDRQIEIYLNENFLHETKIQIFNSQGVLINKLNSKNCQSIKIGLSQCGLYIVRAINLNNTSSYKIIIQ